MHDFEKGMEAVVAPSEGGEPISLSVRFRRLPVELRYRPRQVPVEPRRRGGSYHRSLFSYRERLGAGEVKVTPNTANRFQLEDAAAAPSFLATSEAMYAAPLPTTDGAFRSLCPDRGPVGVTG